MPRESRRKEHLSEEEIRERVNQVMDDWQSYPDFAHLFAALLNACDHMQPTEFARKYTERTGRYTSSTCPAFIRDGRNQPSYRFVADILDHRLFPFDDARIRPATAGLPAGDYRIALFAKAGLIEVTADSICEWNEDVLASWQRRARSQPQREPLRWKELIHKLLDFHTQGGRLDADDLADAAPRLPGLNCTLDGQRIYNLLESDCVPTRVERQALALVAGLTAEQDALIEAGLESGILSLRPKATQTSSLSGAKEGVSP